MKWHLIKQFSSNSLFTISIQTIHRQVGNNVAETISKINFIKSQRSVLSILRALRAFQVFSVANQQVVIGTEEEETQIKLN